MRTIAAALLAVVLAAGVARAEEEAGARAIGFASSTGLVGMRNLIDARVPALFSVRGVLRFEHMSTNTDSPVARSSQDLFEGDAIAGVSALGLADVGVRFPIELRLDRDDAHGAAPRHARVTGAGDLAAAAKVGLSLGPVTVGPYALFKGATGSRHLETSNSTTYNLGSRRFEFANTFDLGACATAAILSERIAAHLNLAYVTFDGGNLAFAYKLGGSVVPWADDTLVLRVFAYLDGLEYGGTPGSDVRASFGVQTLLFRFVALELASEVKVYDGDLGRSVRDLGTYGIDFAAGVSITF